MSGELIKQELYIKPGTICIPYKKTLLYSVAGSGIIVTIYDTHLKIGGMTHFLLPKRRNRSIMTPVYAYPAILGLVKYLIKRGSKIRDLEAHIFGGAENRDAEGYIKGLSDENIIAAEEILRRKNIFIAGKDTGSFRGRKIMFNTHTGETVSARVNSIRKNDWYPRTF